jgi:hypothetical protein
MPSGALPNGCTKTLVYVRYNRTGVNKIEVMHDMTHPTGWAWIKLPDRELCIGLQSTNGRPVRNTPDDACWDYCLDTDTYKKDGLGEKYLSYAMISAHNGLCAGKALSQVLETRSFITSEKLRICADSGGAQLKLGSAKYIDPVPVIDWYNKVADVGTMLDVPPRPCDHGDMAALRGCMVAQNKNAKVFAERKRPNLRLLNCLHGYDMEGQMEFAKTVNNPDLFEGWAVGSDNQTSDLSNLRGVIIAAQKFTGKHFHVFAIGGKQRIPPLAWLGRYVPLMTSDATVHLTGIQYHHYHWLDLNGILGKEAVGDVSTCMRNGNVPLPCSCEVCNVVKYWEVFQLPTQTGTGGLLTWHNMAAFATYANIWNKHAQDAKSIEEFIQLIYKTFNQNTANYIETKTRYIEAAFTEGLEEAETKFALSMGAQPVTSGFVKPLFGQVSKKGFRPMNLTQQPSATEDTLPNYLTQAEMRQCGIVTAGPPVES